MKIYQGNQALDFEDESCVTIGNFDGVHLGHLSLIERSKTRAKALQLRAIALTFDPHPVRFFKGPDAPPFLLSTLDQRLFALKDSGLDATVVLPFDATLAAMTPDDFIEEILVKRLKAKNVVVGYDFSFGRRRSGSIDDLLRLGESLGYTAESIPPFYLDDAPVSSSRIREALAKGDVRTSERLLGRPYALSGFIAHGDKRGQKLGFPTANLAQTEQILPALGIYISSLERSDNHKVFPAITSIGVRPTFPDAGPDPVVETYLFTDESPDLYGVHVEVKLLKRLREERRYDSTEALLNQIYLDVAQAKSFHNL